MRFSLFISQLSERLTGDFLFPVTRVYFLRATAFILILNYALFWLPEASDYWGTERLLMPYYKTSYPIFYPFNLLEIYTFDWLWKAFLFTLFILCLLALYKPLNWALWAGIYWTHANLFHGTAALQNAGSNTLLICMLLVLLMVPFPFRSLSTRQKWVLNSVCHLGFAMIIFQILLLYFVASLAKLGGTKWLDGSAFYFVLMNDLYTHPWWRETFAGHDFIIKSVSWFTLAFQLAFPLLVWFRATKLLFLLLGMFFHILIIFVMGIEDFGLIMMVLYIPLLGEKRIRNFDIRLKSLMTARK